MGSPAYKLDYDLFDYDYENHPLQLDEAISKARQLRSHAAGGVFYRVVPTDSRGTEFRVVAVQRDEIARSFFDKFAHWITRFNQVNKNRSNG
jgi:hypothetical protein